MYVTSLIFDVCDAYCMSVMTLMFMITVTSEKAWIFMTTSERTQTLLDQVNIYFVRLFEYSHFNIAKLRFIRNY
jgi:hypothetical protein